MVTDGWSAAVGARAPLPSLLSIAPTAAQLRRAHTTHTHLPSPQEAAEAEEGSDSEDEFVYNPLKLPLGWDGKPIPYWLYKLHGLNVELKCEICGAWGASGRQGGRHRG